MDVLLPNCPRSRADSLLREPTFRRTYNGPGVDSATNGLSQVDYGAENGAGKRWV